MLDQCVSEHLGKQSASFQSVMCGQVAYNTLIAYAAGINLTAPIHQNHVWRLMIMKPFSSDVIQRSNVGRLIS